jgi:hypothetical protein
LSAISVPHWRQIIGRLYFAHLFPDEIQVYSCDFVDVKEVSSRPQFTME